MDGFNISELTEKDIHCLTRMLQQQLYNSEGVQDILLPCALCKYSGMSRECHKEYYLSELRDKLERLTGIYLKPLGGFAATAKSWNASWMEDYPDLKKKFEQMDYSEQEKYFKEHTEEIKSMLVDIRRRE